MGCKTELVVTLAPDLVDGDELPMASGVVDADWTGVDVDGELGCAVWATGAGASVEPEPHPHANSNNGNAAKSFLTARPLSIFRSKLPLHP
jgi:hypothetical protein